MCQLREGPRGRGELIRLAYADVILDEQTVETLGFLARDLG